MKTNNNGWNNEKRLLLIFLIISYIALSLWVMHLERQYELRNMADPDTEDSRQLEEMREYHDRNTLIFR